MAPEPRPRPRTGGSKREHILEAGTARVNGDCRRPAVDTKPADELLRPVGCAEDAGCDDLLPARPLARLLGELDEQVDAGGDGEGQAEPDGALGAGGERCLGRD